MQWLVELSNEHPTLPAAEALGATRAITGQAREIHRADGILVLEAPELDARALADRLSLSYAVSALWWRAPPDRAAILDRFGQADVHKRRFAIRARRIMRWHDHLPVQDIVREAGALVARTGKVDLTSPETEIRLVVSDEAYAGELAAHVDRVAYEQRHVRHRPLFSPTSIHPHYARALVNLARVKAGDRVVDPFCGTGGIALEAGLVGARVHASDLDARMAQGTRECLLKFGVTPAAVEARDVGEIPEFMGAGTVDAVLTDPPYGRASTTHREALEDLYGRFFAAAFEALAPAGRLGIIVPDEKWVRMASTRFLLEQQHEMKVHRSLKRIFAIFRKA